MGNPSREKLVIQRQQLMAELEKQKQQDAELEEQISRLQDRRNGAPNNDKQLDAAIKQLKSKLSTAGIPGVTISKRQRVERQLADIKKELEHLYLVDPNRKAGTSVESWENFGNTPPVFDTKNWSSQAQVYAPQDEAQRLAKELMGYGEVTIGTEDATPRWQAAEDAIIKLVSNLNKDPAKLLRVTQALYDIAEKQSPGELAQYGIKRPE